MSEASAVPGCGTSTTNAASMDRCAEMCRADVFLFVGLRAWQILAELQCIFEAQGSPAAIQREVALSARGWTGDSQQRAAWWKDAVVSWSRAAGVFLPHWLLRSNPFQWKLALTRAVLRRTSQVFDCMFHANANKIRGTDAFTWRSLKKPDNKICVPVTS